MTDQRQPGGLFMAAKLIIDGFTAGIIDAEQAERLLNVLIRPNTPTVVNNATTVHPNWLMGHQNDEFFLAWLKDTRQTLPATPEQLRKAIEQYRQAIAAAKHGE
jgi:hypothetical protein